MDSKTLRLPLETLQPAKPICVKQNQPVSQAIKTMQDRRIGCVCVVNEEKKLIGILTERDVLTRVVAGNLDVEEVQVKDVMTPNPEYLFIDDQIAFALNRMHVGGFRHVPLTDLQGHPTGVISVKDIVLHLLNHVKQRKPAQGGQRAN